MPAFKNALKFLFIAIFSISLSACGGSSATPGTGTDDPGDGDNNGGGNGNADAWTAEFSHAGEINAKQQITILFSESMDPDTLVISGTLGRMNHEWSSENNENDSLTIRPVNFWPPGNRTLAIDASSAEGIESTAETNFRVGSAFSNRHEGVQVFGQPDFESGERRQGFSGPHANTFDTPLGSAAYAGDKDILFIADTWDSRVLGYRGIPNVSSNANADFVLGQPDFNSSMGEVSEERMVSPQYVTTDNGRLIVSDTEAYRVVIYDDIPEDGSARPAVVVGQPDLNTRIDRPPCDARTLNHLHSHFLTESGMFLVASSWQNRVLIWDQLPTEDYQPADRVLGQPHLETCSDVPNSTRFRHPTDIWTDEEKLIILDSEKHRILIWNTFPTENFANPDVVIGQSNLTNEAPNDDDQDGERDAQASARVMDYPRSIAVDEHGQLYVADMDNHRVLIWHEIPTENFAPADVVLGHDDFHSTGSDIEYGENEAPTSARMFNSPTGVSVIGDKLFVTERFNHRVLVLEAQ